MYKHAQSGLETSSNTSSIEEIIFIVIILLQNIIYLLFGYKKISQYNQSILSNYSTIDKIQVRWLSKLFIVWLLLLVVPLVIYFINYIYPIVDLHFLELFLMISLVAVAIYFSTHIINQYYADFTLSKNDKVTKANSPKIDLDKLNNIYIELNKLMESEKPYLNEDLTLGKLSEQMNIKPTQLSAIIKTQTTGNFYDYINNFRIEAVKKELTNTNKQIIIIAYGNGFSSKSTFNKVFKDITGDSPSQFRKKDNLVL